MFDLLANSTGIELLTRREGGQTFAIHLASTKKTLADSTSAIYGSVRNEWPGGKKVKREIAVVAFLAAKMVFENCTGPRFEREK